MAGQSRYTCNDYREEMILAGLRKKLEQEDLSEEQKKAIVEEINKLEKTMSMD